MKISVGGDVIYFRVLYIVGNYWELLLRDASSHLLKFVRRLVLAFCDSLVEPEFFVSAQ